MTAFVGTSGWQYADWRASFYPPRMPLGCWLEYYAERFATLEVNNAFYRLPEKQTFSSWRERTPPGFVFAVKASRYLTHIRRLRDPAEPVERLVERLQGLGEKLGPVLLQLPPTLKIELSALDETLACFPATVRVAVEFRHTSWFVDDAADLLARHHAAYCLADRPGLRAPEWRTTNWGYIRFHEGRAAPRPCYGKAALTSWARRLSELFGSELDVYAYFNNDPHGCAPKNAASFVRLLERTGIPVHHSQSRST